MPIDVTEIFTVEQGFTVANLHAMIAGWHANLQEKIVSRELDAELGLEHQQLLNPQTFLAYFVSICLAADKLPETPCPLFVHVRMDFQDTVNEIARLVIADHVLDVWVDGTEGQVRSDPWPDGKPGQCFQGFEFWRAALIKAGVPDVMVHRTGPSYNTPDEHKQMLELGQKHGWTEVMVVGNAYQLPRIHTGLIQHMKNAKFWIRAHYSMPKISSLNQPMLGPQGSDGGAVFNQFAVEFIRWVEYSAKTERDLASLLEAANYFIYGRDSISDGKLIKPLS